MNKQIDMFQNVTKRVPDTAYQKGALQNIEERKMKNKSQNEIILAFFEENRGQGFTAWEVKRRLHFDLITSVRRSISTLTSAGVLEKLNERKLECQGEPNHYYKII